MKHLFIFLLLISLISCSREQHVSPGSMSIARTEGGYVSGSYEDSVFVFKGIPYAAPPIGDLRWRAPQPVRPWTDTLQCQRFGASPIQNDPKPFMMWSEEFMTPASPLNEDCLFLNIWSGAQSPNEKLPVFVWIHGGAFQSGSGACPIYDGAAMARKGIVFVSINYRLGAFGFLAHPELTAESEHQASGNYGLMDQIAALRWIKNNIEAFGGDPSKVTIGGQSAGSMSVQALVASPLVKDLIQGAIAESGATIQPGTTLQQAEETGVKFVRVANGTGIRDLRALPADTIQKFSNRMPFGSFFPNIDGYVLPNDMVSIFKSRKHNDVPLLAGWVSGDGALAVGQPVSAREYRESGAQRYGVDIQKLLKLFPADNDEQAARSQRRLGALYFAGFGNHVWAGASSSPAYLYEFTYVPTDKPGFPNYGAFHTAEVPYALHTLKYWDRPWTPVDRKVESYMSTYWINFIKNGNPNTKDVPEWRPYSVQEGFMMNLGSVPEPTTGKYREAIELILSP